jgi:hypothetical protein
MELCQVVIDKPEQFLRRARERVAKHTPGGHEHDQDTHGRRGGGSESEIANIFSKMPMGKATTKEAKKWRKDNQGRYDADSEFRAAVDAATLYTQGDYAHINASSTFLNTGEWSERWKDSSVPGWLRENGPLMGNPMANYKTYFDGQAIGSGASSKYRDAVTALNKVVMGAPHVGTIYRGINPNVMNSMDLKPGSIYDVTGVASFTSDEHLAHQFAWGIARGQRSKSRGGYRTPGAVIEVRNARGLNVSALSPWDQKEVLSMGRLRVLSAERAPTKPLRIVMEYDDLGKRDKPAVAPDPFLEPFLYGELTAPDFDEHVCRKP